MESALGGTEGTQEAEVVEPGPAAAGWVVVLDQAGAPDPEQARRLAAAGFRVDVVASPKEALSRLAEEPFEMILAAGGCVRPVAEMLGCLTRHGLASGACPWVQRRGSLPTPETFDRALADLRIAYQPIVRSEDGALYGYEALVRGAEPGLHLPGALFAAAERLGRVGELGRCIREEVARTAAAVAEPAVVFVNLHASDLRDDSLLDGSLTRLAPRVVLEITERAPLHGIADLHERIDALRAAGFRIAVDDLGAGYSGLASFAVLQPDVVKLDLSIVQDLDRVPLKRKLVASISGMCRELGVTVVAEGIERREEQEAAAGLGCELLQGYLFGRPAEMVFPA